MLKNIFRKKIAPPAKEDNTSELIHTFIKIINLLKLNNDCQAKLSSLTSNPYDSVEYHLVLKLFGADIMLNENPDEVLDPSLEHHFDRYIKGMIEKREKQINEYTQAKTELEKACKEMTPPFMNLSLDHIEERQKDLNNAIEEQHVKHSNLRDEYARLDKQYSKLKKLSKREKKESRKALKELENKLIKSEDKLRKSIRVMFRTREQIEKNYFKLINEQLSGLIEEFNDKAKGYEKKICKNIKKSKEGEELKDAIKYFQASQQDHMKDIGGEINILEMLNQKEAKKTKEVKKVQKEQEKQEKQKVDNESKISKFFTTSQKIRKKSKIAPCLLQY